VRWSEAEKGRSKKEELRLSPCEPLDSKSFREWVERNHLKLIRCPRSLASTLVALPSMSLIPSAPFDAVDRLPTVALSRL
jgi:hypothetical protein